MRTKTLLHGTDGTEHLFLSGTTGKEMVYVLNACLGWLKGEGRDETKTFRTSCLYRLSFFLASSADCLILSCRSLISDSFLEDSDYSKMYITDYFIKAHNTVKFTVRAAQLITPPKNIALWLSEIINKAKIFHTKAAHDVVFSVSQNSLINSKQVTFKG